ncbi:MAG TPA: MarR family transcriptional regulator [Candidatus Hydrogenedentes bacterium]|nr:MarR family transcriptional regulator [Candidatus Hydrogenedentota bacterium]
MSLKEELGLRNDFKVRAHEALLHIYFTAAKGQKKADEFFRAHGLTDVQFNVMMLLLNQSGESGGLTQVELSRMMLVNRANITTLIDRMEKSRLVVRVADPGDRRYNVVKITPHGEKLFRKAAAVYHEKVGAIMSALKEPEQRMLMSLLTRVREKMDTIPIS